MSKQSNTLNHQGDYSLTSSNAFGFLRLPVVFEPYTRNADWVITGIPFDIATSGRSGARQGPEGIRKASTNLAWEGCRWPWDFNLNEHLNIIDCGDLVFKWGDAEDMCIQLETHIDKLLTGGKRAFNFGGDHFVTLPSLRAHAKHFGKMALIHFDAHTDTYSNGSKFDHGTMFYHAPKEGLIDPKHSIQLGIRTDYQRELDFTVIDAADFNERSIDSILQEVTEVVGDLPIYLTFDIDCLDPAYAPGTGTPVVGGLTTDKVLKLLRKFTTLNIVGMDVVEVAPAYDHAEITSLAAATIALELLHLQAVKK